MPPIRLSDSELDAVMAAARPLAVERRDALLQAVVGALQGVSRGRPRRRPSGLRRNPTGVLRPAAACSGRAWPRCEISLSLAATRATPLSTHGRSFGGI